MPTDTDMDSRDSDLKEMDVPKDGSQTGAGGGDAEVPIWIRWSNAGFVATLVLVILGYAGYELFTWPDVAGLSSRTPENTAFIQEYRDEQAAAGEGEEPRWTWVPYDSISVHMKRAAVAGEDIGFFSHDGFAVEEIRVAIGDAVSGRRDLRGASTITQQVAKNLWLSPSRNPLRKFREALLTRQLEKHLSKKRILEIYLNIAELGPGVYGVEAAAREYFDKPAIELTENEAAQIAAALPRPASWHPGVANGSYEWYVGEIENRMKRAQFLWRRVK